jgi:hypothetical protein
MSAFLMQRLPMLEGLFCPAALIMVFGNTASNVERCGIFESMEVIASK